jgi:thiol-disulfide isomerase/thioredoxin
MAILFDDKTNMNVNQPIIKMTMLMRKYRSYFLMSAFIFLSQNIYSQDVEIYNFHQFESILNQGSDTVYVLNFWATWCAPCVKELPDFQKLNDHYQGQKFRMILVSLDFRKQMDTRLKPFIRDHELSPEVILLHEPDANSWIDRVDPSWSGAIPATLIFSKEKRIFREGDFTFEELNKIMNDFGLSETASKNIKP